jgi:Arc/MetJ-type ribon-helix-helix transcriptional regulator
MTYQFPPDIEQRVQARMSVCGHESADDVLREAMDALETLEQSKLRRWNERNQIAIEQSRQGLSKPLDLESLLERVERRFAKHFQGE